MCSKTTIAASPNFEENKMWLNGRLVGNFHNSAMALIIILILKKVVALISFVVCPWRRS